MVASQHSHKLAAVRKDRLSDTLREVLFMMISNEEVLQSHNFVSRHQVGRQIRAIT
jgi:hypothetical protein